MYGLPGPLDCSCLATEMMWRAFLPPFMTLFLEKKLFAFLFLWPLLKINLSSGFEIQSFVSVGYMSIWYKNSVDVSVN